MHRRKCATAAGLILLLIAALYFAGIVYFTDHFYYDTKVNGIDFSWGTVKDVEKYLADEISQYVLTVRPREGADEVISAEDVSLEYVSDGSVQKLVEGQDRFMWPEMLKETDELSCAKKAVFDRKKAEEKVLSLKCIKEEGKFVSKDAFIDFDGESYKIIPEIYGTLANKRIAVNSVYDAVSRLDGELDLEDAGCYTDPERHSDDKKLVEAVQTLNKCCSARITYEMSSGNEVVDKELISGWLSWDNDLNVTLDEESVSEYVSGLAARFNKAFRAGRKYFTTPTGKTASISGASYGWKLNKEAEEEALLSSIKAGETVTRKPFHTRFGSEAGPAWGSTYIDLDLTEQHMWCIIGGEVAMESDVITGRPDGVHNTPSGLHRILAMQRNRVLVGNIVPSTGRPEYRTRVAYWMRITNYGVGFHDATWQTSGFGGRQYLYTGSHGCINMPYNAAATLYSLVYVGMPVVIHY